MSIPVERGVNILPKNRIISDRVQNSDWYGNKPIHNGVNSDS
jgi:hypothetical protein